MMEQLIKIGNPDGTGVERRRLVNACAKALETDPAAENVIRWHVPGRIEVLGKHTDYAGGRSLLAATEQGFVAIAVPQATPVISAIDVFSGERVTFELSAEIEPRRGHWSNYIMTVARRMARDFPGLKRGVKLAFASDLPTAAGLSSSSALITAAFLVLSDANDLPFQDRYQSHLSTTELLAEYLGAVESGRGFGPFDSDHGVGTLGGSQDHAAILCSEPGRLVQYSFMPVRKEQSIPLPADLLFVVACSGVVAEKTGDARTLYNRASRSVATILQIWNSAQQRNDRSLAGILRSGRDATQRLRELLRRAAHAEFSPQVLLDRLEQFTSESERIIPAVADLLMQGRVEDIGPLVDESQVLAERLLDNQVPQTVHLARAARELGALAASAFGAGFGGSVWALVPREDAADFITNWKSSYEQAHPVTARRACFLTTPAASPAKLLSAR